MTLIIAAKSLDGICFAYDTKVQLFDGTTNKGKGEIHNPKLVPLPGRNDIVLGWAGQLIGQIDKLYDEVADAVKDVSNERISDVKDKILEYIAARRARNLSTRSGRREGMGFMFGITDGINVRAYVTNEVPTSCQEIKVCAAMGIVRDRKTIRNLTDKYFSCTDSVYSGVKVLAWLNEVMEEELKENELLAGKGSCILTPKGYLKIS
ncbi:MAG TPA: hypothetical protein VJI98_03455 [Candidatus Nanoarchaeia archaeon]|nr:hypothetical protein [Candidatus Nanoarchaeia archaeon]